VRVATLRRALPPADLIEFVRMFLDDLGGVTNRIQKLIAVQELDELCQEAHALAGTAGNVGALRLSHWARQLEHACKERDTASIDRSASTVAQTLPQTQIELSRWLDEQEIDAYRPMSGTLSLVPATPSCGQWTGSLGPDVADRTAL
jgi:HPt (histidine-containing phosphotransfer) domain-containing protein